MVKCSHCGEEFPENLIYQCSKCGKNFCSYHKNPTDHDCESIIGTSITQQAQVTTQAYTEIRSTPYQQQITNVEPSSGVERGTTDGSYTWYRQERSIPENAFDPDSGVEFKGILFPHKSEFFHFIIGGSLIFLIGFMAFYSQTLISQGYGWAILMLAGFYTTAFLFHEFGHRQTAKHYKLQTKFRLLTNGMILTILSLILTIIWVASGSPPLPAFALPGAVVVLGLDKIDRKTGWTKAAGPIVNLVYGTILLIISLSVESYPLNLFIGYASFLNFSLGAFNMIPIGILDGQNIWKWNKGLYISLFSSLIIMLILTIILIYDQSLYYPGQI